MIAAILSQGLRDISISEAIIYILSALAGIMLTLPLH